MTVQDRHIDFPDLRHYSDTPMYNTKAVVQQTSVPAPTLRAWERRYNLLSPERAGNAYRLYSERDIVMIRWLKERVDEGIAISQAIALFQHLAEEYQKLEELPGNVSDSTIFHVALPEQEQPEEEIPPKGDKENRARQVENWPTVNSPQTSPSYSYPSVYNMRVVQKRLLEAFKALDEPTCSMLMASMLAIYPVEKVCLELITPTLWKIGQLWEEAKITVSVEHFASGIFRGLLTNLLHVTPGSTTGPLVIVCCAPGEPHELAPMMLALFLRRAGVRVAYLGQSIETAGLLQTIRQLSPALVCVSLTIPAYLASLIDLAKQVQSLPAPRPMFAFGGQVFATYTHLVSQVPGQYLDGDLVQVTEHLHHVVLERGESKN